MPEPSANLFPPENWQRLCPACNYDLRAHPQITQCPECGTPTRSGPITLHGSEHAGPRPLPTILLQSGIVCLIFGIIPLLADRKSPLALLLIFTLGAAFTITGIFYRPKHMPRCTLRLTTAGFDYLNADTHLHLADRWRPGDSLSVTRRKTYPARLVTLKRYGQPTIQLSLAELPLHPDAMIEQVADWAREQHNLTRGLPFDPLQPYRHCPHCAAPASLSPCPSCSLPITHPLYVFPLVPRLDLSTPLLLLISAFLLILVFPPILFLKLITPIPVALGWLPIILLPELIPALVFRLLPPTQYTSNQVARLSPTGYQFCHHTAPLKLRPLNRRHYHLTPSQRPSFFYLRISRNTPTLTGLPTDRRIILLPNLAEPLQAALNETNKTP